MKIAEGLKIIETGWIQKSKGYRVRFNRQSETGFEQEYSPPLTDALLTSDVTAWRYAWKLWQATRTGAVAEVLYNITVVDDENREVPFYATGEMKIYNPRKIAADHDQIEENEETVSGQLASKRSK